jgi:hypothetical protein
MCDADHDVIWLQLPVLLLLILLLLLLLQTCHSPHLRV